VTGEEVRKMILAVRTELNSKNAFFSDIRYLRFLSVLLYMMNSNLFREEGLLNYAKSYFNSYSLDKAAKKLSLDLNRKRAPEVFEKAISLHEAKKIRNKKGTEFYRLTTQGIKTCKDGLTELAQLKIHPKIEEAKQEYRRRMISRPTTQMSYFVPPDPEVAELLRRMKRISRSWTR